MLFSTPFFLFIFLPAFLVLYWVFPARRPVLLLGSTVFYAWSEPRFVLIVYASTLFDWLLGQQLAALPAERQRVRKFLVACGVASNLGLLIYFKYTAFGIGSVNALLAHFSVAQFGVPTIVLPLGVSFIVFEKITYVVDLYRGIVRPAVSFLDYCNYVFLFPKLLAGPIVKYHDIAPQLSRPSHGYEDLRDGLIRFVQGLAKKVLIADTLSPMADTVFTAPPANLDPASAWLGLLCFTFQIYFDFSGYSDMAIGLARILGFRLLENFNHPYLATSFTDFWRRWHISLSSWIKEYLYIPLGGNRVSIMRSYANLCICFVLSGLWHGASWNFLLWGCVHGVALVADRAFWLRWQTALPRGLNMALTFVLVMFSWVFFRCPTFGEAIHYFQALAGAPAEPGIDPPTPAVVFMLWLSGVLVLAPLLAGRLDPDRWAAPATRRLVALAGCVVLLLLAVGRMAANSFQPFLYFRF